MRQVFIPLDEQMKQIVLTKADLLNESEMKPCLLRLVAHVEAYRILIEKWEAGDLRALQVDQLPTDLKQYAEEGFAKLKGEQQELLRRRRR